MTSFKKYFSPQAYLRFALNKINHHILHYVDIAVAPDPTMPFIQPPTFIIGAPRSGSTLLFQVMTDAFDVAYLSNRHCQFFGAPALAERTFKPLRNKKPSDFTSFHGQTNGPDAPSECGAWWYRFFRREPAYVTLDDVDERKMIAFRRSLLALTEVTQKPLIFKNLYAGLRLEPISKYVPEALFIIIKREELYNAASILAGRMKALGTYDKWWSVPPPDVNKLKDKPPHEQVIGQIRSIYQEIERVARDGFIEQDRMLQIEYEHLCQDTAKTLQRIESFWAKHNLIVEHRFPVPEKFTINRNMNIPPELQKDLISYSGKCATN